MLDAENDCFSNPMARPYGYVAPRLVARIFQSPRGNLEIALRDLCITQPPSDNTWPGGNTGLRLPAPRQAHSPSGYTGYMVIAQILQLLRHQTYAPAQAGAALISW